MTIPKDPIEFWAAFLGLATLVAAIGTVAAFVVAFLQIRTERQARRRAESEAAADQLRHQARLVSAWVSGHDWVADDVAEPGPLGDDAAVENTIVTLRNGSDEPVYGAVAWLVFVQGAGPRTGEGYGGDPMRARLVSVLVPAGVRDIEFPADWRGMSARVAVEVAFTDAAGTHWVRRATGALEQLASAPVEHYGLGPGPLDWQ